MILESVKHQVVSTMDKKLNANRELLPSLLPTQPGIDYVLPNEIRRYMVIQTTRNPSKAFL